MSVLPRSLSLRLVLLIMLVAVPGVAMLAAKAWEDRAEAIAAARLRAIDTVDLLAEDQARLIEDTRNYLRRLAQFPEVLRPEQPACSALLGQVLSLSEHYVNLGVPRADGELLCNALPLNKRVNVADRPYIRRALDQRVFSIGEFQTDRAAGVTSVNFAYPLEDPADGHLVGTAVAVVSLDWWSRRLSQHSLPQGTLAYIADSDHTIIAHFPTANERLGMKLEQLHIRPPTPGGDAGHAIAISRDPNGTTRIFASTRLIEAGNRPVYVGVGIPFDAQLAAIESQAVTTGLMLLFFIALMFAAALWGVRVSVLRPLEQLARSTRELESGRPQSSWQFGGALELVRLQKQFARMAQKRLETERLLQDSRNYNRTLFETSPIGLALRTRDGQLVDANPAFAAILGRHVDEVRLFHYRDIAGPDWAAEEAERLRDLAPGDVSGPSEMEFLHRAGHRVPVRVSSLLLEREGHQYVWSSVEDITADKLAEARLKLAASVFTHAREGIFITDADGIVVDINQTLCEITGYGREESVGKPSRFLAAGPHAAEFFESVWRLLRERGDWYGEIRNRRKNGETYVATLTISAVQDSDGQVMNYVALLTDITLMKAHEQRLEHIAHYDALTGLPNRVLLADRLRQAMAQSQRRDRALAVAYLDLDGFKPVNDSHGHNIGDKLLITVAERMKEALRSGDTLARIGGDEFVAVLVDLERQRDCELVLERLLAAAANPAHIDGLALQVSVSIGVTLYPQDGADADMLLRHADQAMYSAKQAGKNRYQLFDVDVDEALKVRHAGQQDIVHAFERREFVLHYQPKVDMRSGALVGVEALLRWQHPERGLLLPASFLPVIEDHVVSVELGEWVIDSALRQVGEWLAAGLDVPVSVNVGARQLQQADFVQRLSELLAAHSSVTPRHLELEIVETSALEDVAQVCELMHACLSLGVRFSLDDFGTGYSSLTYLKRLPAGLLKIDQSFVRDMLDDPDDLAIVEGVVGLATAFRREVIAEGVETVAHGTRLLQIGCTLAQGYGIARPMPAADLPRWLDEWKPDEAWQRS